MNLKALEEQRAELVEQMEALLNGAKEEVRALNEEELNKFAELETSIKNIDSTIDIEKRAQELEIKKSEVSNMEQNKNTLSIETREEMAFESFVRGVVADEEVRADEILTKGANGNIVPKSIVNRIITEVKDRVDFLNDCQVVYSKGTLSFPSYSDTSEAAYVDETAESPANQGSFTTVELTGYVIEAVSLLSIQMINNTDFDLVNFIIGEVAQKIADKLEKEFIHGTSTKITGILSNDQNNVTTQAAALTYDDLVTMKHTLKRQFQRAGKWVMNPNTWTAICLLKDGNGHPYFGDDSYTILGCPVRITDQMPEDKIVFGDLNGYTIKLNKGVEMNILKELYSRKRMIGFQAFVEVDAKPVDKQRYGILTIQ